MHVSSIKKAVVLNRKPLQRLLHNYEENIGTSSSFVNKIPREPLDVLD